MMATRWISRTLLVLMFGSVSANLPARASAETEGDPIAGVDGRVRVEPEQLAARKLERFGARLTFDDRKDGRPVVGVDLSNCPMIGAAMKELQALPNLRYLNLKGTRLDDRELKTLTSLKHLQILVLEGTNTTLPFRAELRAAIPGLTIDFGVRSGEERQTGYVPPPAVVP
ncbi:MAG TPA: leucine-rich repeat domain-containing protein [Gemmataceae bacterium]|jgi:hypothetical protein